MKSVSFFIATRYLLKNRYEKSLSTIVIITFLSIFIGTFSLALTTAIMNGFEKSVHSKMQNIHPQATIYSSGGSLNPDAIEALIKKEFPEISAISPQAIGHVILQTDDEEELTPTVALLKGINPLQEIAVTAIDSKMLNGQSLITAIHNDHIALGKSLALQLNVTQSDTMPLLYLEQTDGRNKLSVCREHARVGGLFATGIDEFDSNLILCSHELFNTLFPEQGITQIGLSFAHNIDIPKTVARLRQRLGLEVFSWQELYPALVSALALEKYTMFFILLLITLIAAMNIISLISMLITQKRADIAILRAMGIVPQTITAIFMIIGICIAGIAALAGILCACVASILLERYPFIKLPHVYYVSHLPAHMEWNIVVMVLGVVLLITMFATWLAAQRAKSITIAHVLRFEG
jgi:lipoprotein-releasing system permease protein